ncbi:MAG: hypothetical protein EOM21_21485, partial [Gammaproteobacteria bacterium]|nr:hypothetical protein [Gammaproteobacteria bacterium]
MADGKTKKAGDIVVGDRVLGFDTSGDCVPCNVISTELTVKKTARYTLSDKSTFECSTDHAFPVWNAKRKKFQEFPIGEIAKRSDNYLYLLSSKKTVFEKQQELEIDPYVLGVIIGDCCITQSFVSITNPDSEVIEAFNVVENVSAVKRNGKDAYGIVSKLRTKEGYSFNPLVSDLRKLGLMGCGSHNKFIPHKYKISTEHDRKQILAGLVDTDGYVDEGGQIEFCTVSEQLAEDVIFILRSLRVRATKRERTIDTNFKKGCRHFRINWTADLPLRVERKKNRIRPRIKQCSDRVYVEKEEIIGEEVCIDISIDHPSHLFLLDNFIATHNTYSGAREALRQAWNSKLPISIPYGIIAPTYHMLDRTTWREF